MQKLAIKQAISILTFCQIATILKCHQFLNMSSIYFLLSWKKKKNHHTKYIHQLQDSFSISETFQITEMQQFSCRVPPLFYNTHQSFAHASHHSGENRQHPLPPWHTHPQLPFLYRLSSSVKLWALPSVLNDWTEKELSMVVPENMLSIIHWATLLFLVFFSSVALESFEHSFLNYAVTVSLLMLTA